jgi:hypothetical protein
MDDNYELSGRGNPDCYDFTFPSFTCLRQIAPHPRLLQANDHSEQPPATAHRKSLDLTFSATSQSVPLLCQELLSLLHCTVRSTAE